MDPPFSGFVLDPSKCRKMSMEEKRELVRELSKWPESAPEKLQTWSRKDLLEILCAEIGKERKYTGMTKHKMIEALFKVVCEKKNGEKEDTDSNPDTPKTLSQSPAKRQRKNDHPSRLTVVPNSSSGCDDSDASSMSDIRYCQNLACRAALSQEDSFCKRCSCCICHKYDDNKDPSLWLFCSSETLSEGSSCGLSCHIECALKHEKTGILSNGKSTKLDGKYYCINCGKENDLLGCWKKQLTIAKDARRVDVLCYRIYLTHRLLISTQKYKDLLEIVGTALKKLEAEVGSTIDGFSSMARGIVNRLSVGAEVQRMCSSAVELLDRLIHISTLSSDTQVTAAKLIKFEDISPTSLNIVLSLEGSLALSKELAGFTLWHRKADGMAYPKEPTCTLFSPKNRALITELVPATKYDFKVVAFSSMKDLGMWELGVATESILADGSMNLLLEESTFKSQSLSPKENSSGLSNPSTVEVSNNNHIEYTDLNKSPECSFDCCEKPEILDSENLSAHGQNDNQKNEGRDIVSRNEVNGPEETPEHCGSALDKEPIRGSQMEINRHSTNSVDNNQASDMPRSENDSNAPVATDVAIIPSNHSDKTLPAAPCQLVAGNDGPWRGGICKSGPKLLEGSLTKPDREPGSSSKKRGKEVFGQTCVKHGSLEVAYEYCVKVIRWLECEGHIETNFRVKFLTWLSLRATPQERRIVSIYVDTLIDDPASLAGQLVDTFSEAICRKRLPPVPNGFCMKLWH